MPNLSFAERTSGKDARAIAVYLGDYSQSLRNSGIRVRGKVNGNVDSRDEMYAFALANCPSQSMAALGYFRAGAQLQATLRQVSNWYFGERRERKTILDFACGYGRSTRFLVDEFADDEVYASDILPGAMEFQGQELGVKAVLSTTKPNDFKPGKTFDLIWVVSLFTHLPKNTFDQWLKTLYDLLNPGGLLAFTMHDTHHMPPGVPMPRDGFFFQPLTEIPSLDTADYGATVVTEEFVKGAIRRATGQTEYRRLPRVITFRQDLYLIAKGALPNRPLAVMHTPYGCLDRLVWKKNDTLFMKGWALDLNAGQDIAKIEVFLNGKLIATPTRGLERPDIVEYTRQFVGDRSSAFLNSGWSAEVGIDEPLRPYDDILLAKATSTTGLEYLLRCGTLNTMLNFQHLAA